MRDATTMLQWVARCTYHDRASDPACSLSATCEGTSCPLSPTRERAGVRGNHDRARVALAPETESYIVPEGCEVDPTGQFWHRTGDLGNGVQEAEIVKAIRLVIGVDDTNSRRLRIFPRLPYGWSAAKIDAYPALVERGGRTETAHLNYSLRRNGNGMRLTVFSDKPLSTTEVRLGPLPKPANKLRFFLNGKPIKSSVEHSGDSWWVRCRCPEGARKLALELR